MSPHQPLGTDGLQDSTRRRHVQNACLRHPAINPWVRMVFRIPADAGMYKTHACGTPPSTPGYGWSSGFQQAQACIKRMPAAPRHQPRGADGLQDSSRRRHVQNACLRHPAINPWVRMVFRIPADAGMHKTHACGTPPSTPGCGWSSGFQQTQVCTKRMPAAPRHQPLSTDGLQDSSRRRHAQNACLRHPASSDAFLVCMDFGINPLEG